MSVKNGLGFVLVCIIPALLSIWMIIGGLWAGEFVSSLEVQTYPSYAKEAGKTRRLHNAMNSTLAGTVAVACLVPIFLLVLTTRLRPTSSSKLYLDSTGESAFCGVVSPATYAKHRKLPRALEAFFFYVLLSSYIILGVFAIQNTLEWGKVVGASTTGKKGGLDKRGFGDWVDSTVDFLGTLLGITVAAATLGVGMKGGGKKELTVKEITDAYRTVMALSITPFLIYAFFTFPVLYMDLRKLHHHIRSLLPHRPSNVNSTAYSDYGILTIQAPTPDPNSNNNLTNSNPNQIPYVDTVPGLNENAGGMEGNGYPGPPKGGSYEMDVYGLRDEEEGEGMGASSAELPPYSELPEEFEVGTGEGGQAGQRN